MDTTYLVELQKLSRRREGLRKEKEIYEFVLENIGKKITKAGLMRRFRYYMTEIGNTDNFTRTRLLKYVMEDRRQIPTKRGRWITRIDRHIQDLIWLPTEVVDEHRITTKGTKFPRWGHKLCLKETVPFWLLEEYGGPYTGREFIKEIDKRIRSASREINKKLKVLKDQVKGDCPCINCVCIPTCRWKGYPYLVAQCALLKDYIYGRSAPSSEAERELFNYKIQSASNSLKPSKWDANTVVGYETKKGRRKCHR